MIKEFEAVLRSIERMPQLHPMVYREVRKTNLQRFPYFVCYRVGDRSVSVFAVIHSHRDPKVWQKRADER